MRTTHAGPRLSTLVRLAATGGRTDTLRIILTTLGTGAAALVLLLAAAVASIGPSDGPYSMDVLTQPGLRPGVIVVLLLVCVPILVFVGQCARVGAPARDRRLAAMRMAGGTPADVRRIVALESGVAALGGALLGGLAYLVIHVFFSGTQAVRGTYLTESTDSQGGGVVQTMHEVDAAHVLPTDVTPHALLIVLALGLVPVAATLGGMVALRHVTISPFGVVHTETRRPPTVVPAVIFLVGALGLAAWEPVSRWLRLDERDGIGLPSGVALLLFVLAGVGLIFGSASFAYGLGRLLATRTGSPALLIAARRMVAAPFTASRASTAVVMAVLLGAAVQSTRTIFLLTTDSHDTFYADTFALLNVVLVVGIGIAIAGLLVVAVEGIIARRRTLASLVAAGTPRRTLAGATLLETLLPLAPTTVLATIAGLFAARGFFGASVQSETGPADDLGNPTGGLHQVTAPIPWVDLLALAGGTLVAAALVTAAAIPLLRRSTSVSELRAAA